MRRYNGAILADPVGSGKTYVALAVASVINARAVTACLAPATLLSQWKATALRLGVSVSLGSHEQASRGRLPDQTGGLVIIDESHHFRNRLTRRYRHLADWLVGRPALLVTATPIVNRLSDLGYQLWLSVRDDALRLDGVVSLRGLLASGCSSSALGRLVIESEVATQTRPNKVSKISSPNLEERNATVQSIRMLSRLRLSSDVQIASLIRGVLLRAAGSSPAALEGTLRRYRRLLLHAQDAMAAGRTMERAELRRFTRMLNDQLVWWELFPSNCTTSELDLHDLAELDSLISAVAAASQRPDAKLARLARLLTDDKVTLIFTISRDTVRYIRDQLGDSRLAWCTGDRAGIGRSILPRPHVLGWFRQPVDDGPAPQHLVVTEVAAEGLDLQRAARVIHYDLPWTPMRLEQREGRAVRLGSQYREVEVVRFVPSPALERLIRAEATLVQKARLPAVAGLGSAGRQLWRWRAETARQFSEGEPLAGVGAVASERCGALAGFALYHSRNPAVCLSAAVGWLEPDGSWNETPDLVTERLLEASQSPPLALSAQRLSACLEVLAYPIRERLALTRSRRWLSLNPPQSVRQVADRLHRLIRDAARLRDTERLMDLERSLEFVAGGHTAGEIMLIERLAQSDDGELESVLRRVARPPPEWSEVEVRLNGLIVFGNESAEWA